MDPGNHSRLKQEHTATIQGRDLVSRFGGAQNSKRTGVIRRRHGLRRGAELASKVSSPAAVHL